jgi:hypothetical protein
MAEWIVTVILLVTSLIAIYKSIRSSGASDKKRDLWTQSIEQKFKSRDEETKKRDEAIEVKITEIKQILGNGAYHGLRQDIQELKINCAGEMAGIKANIFNQQHEIDNIKTKL